MKSSFKILSILKVLKHSASYASPPSCTLYFEQPANPKILVSFTTGSPIVFFHDAETQQLWISHNDKESLIHHILGRPDGRPKKAPVPRLLP
jgi:hypothetical protein